MNELGLFPSSPRELSRSVRPDHARLAGDIGDEAERYLPQLPPAKAARVRSSKAPTDAGAFAHSVLHPGAAVLAKGSQNGVFAEDSLKILLH